MLTIYPTYRVNVANALRGEAPQRLNRDLSPSMKPLIVIPARMASTRLPGKPLADIAGMPMIVRVCELARASNCGPVLVAAAEQSIVDVVTRAGFDAILTDPALPSGSDRVHAAAETYDSPGTFDAIINLQGDMPTLKPESLETVLAPLEAESTCDIATLASEITDEHEKTNPHVVKAVISFAPKSKQGRALYFTRSTAPHGDGPLFHHIGVYAYRRSALAKFVAAPPTELEIRERLEQLRALELGLRIDCALIPGPPPNGVDTPKDLKQTRAEYKESQVGFAAGSQSRQNSNK